MKPNPLAKLIGRKIVHQCPGARWDGNGPVYTMEASEVTLMAISGHWAMVRRPRAMPYVAPVKELHE